LFNDLMREDSGLVGLTCRVDDFRAINSIALV